MKRRKRLTLALVIILGLTLVLAACASAPEAPSPEAVDSGASLVSDSLKTRSYGAGLVLGIVVLAVTAAIAAALYFYLPPDLGKIRRAVPVGVLLVAMLLSFVFAGYTSVDGGEMGVLLVQGKPVRTMQPGAHFLVPFVNQAKVFSVRTWTYITMSNPQAQGDEEYKDWPVDIITEDGVQASVKYTIQGRLDPEKVMNIYRRYGTLENAIAQLVKHPSRVEVRQSLQGFVADDLISGVDSVEAVVMAAIEPMMRSEGIIMVSFGFRKPTIGLNGEYEKRLDAEQVRLKEVKVQDAQVGVEAALAKQAAAKAEGSKQVAIREAEGRAQSTLAEQEAAADAALYTAQQQAEAKRVTADAQAYQIKAEAEAQAAANRQLAASLTPELVQYIQATGWNGQLPQWVTGSSPLLTVPVPAPE